MAETVRRDADHHAPHLTPTEARQSIMTGHMRYVLGVSLVLAVVVMFVILAVMRPF